MLKETEVRTRLGQRPKRSRLWDPLSPAPERKDPGGSAVRTADSRAVIKAPQLALAPPNVAGAFTPFPVHIGSTLELFPLFKTLFYVSAFKMS